VVRAHLSLRRAGRLETRVGFLADAAVRVSRRDDVRLCCGLLPGHDARSVTSGPVDGGAATRGGGRRAVGARRMALRVLVMALAVNLLLPRLAGLRETVDTIVRLGWWLPPLVIVLETASLACYAEVVRSVLATEGVACTRGLARLAVLVSAAWGKILPGGTIAALPAAARICQRGCVDRAVATAAFVASGAVSSLVLAALLPVAAAFALLARQGGAVALGVVGVAAGTMVLSALAWTGLRDPDLGPRLGGFLRRLGRGRRARMWLHIDEVAAGVERAAVALHEVVRSARGVGRAAALAAASWLFDFAVMAGIALAGTRGAPLAGLGLAYVVGQLTAAVPLTPGGLGVVEAAMTAALAAQGVPAGQAAAVVIAWRLVSHWLPITVGLATDLIVRSSDGRRRRT